VEGFIGGLIALLVWLLLIPIILLVLAFALAIGVFGIAVALLGIAFKLFISALPFLLIVGFIWLLFRPSTSRREIARQ
jgi:hypothetical protein